MTTMPTEYKIQVLMTPHNRDNPTHPYFWCVLANNGRPQDSGEDGWYNTGCGWAKTPEEAWTTASRAYTRFIGPCEEK